MRLNCLSILLAGCCLASATPILAETMPRLPAQEGAGSDIPPELALLLREEPAWSSTASLYSAFGFNDNLLLSYAEPERSSFLRGGFETLLWHLPRARIDYLGFFNAEGTRYFTGKSVNHEAQAFAGLEWRYRWPDVLSFTLDGQGYYRDQIFDVSDTSIQRVVAELKLSGVKLGPTVRWSIWPWLWLEGSVKADRQKFRDHANDAKVRSYAGRLGWSPGDRFELSVVAEEDRNDYDRRLQYSLGGISGTELLVVHERELEGRAIVSWGERKHWKTTSRAGTLQYTDNGSGYLNFRERHAAQEIDWSAGAWSAHAEADLARKEYAHQFIGTGIPDQLFKDEYTAELRVERQVSTHWTIYAEYDWEGARSNDKFARYRMKEGLLGARWTWEK